METVAKGPEHFLLLTQQGSSGMRLTVEASTAANPPFQTAIGVC